MRVQSSGNIVYFFFNLGEKQYWGDDFFLNKKLVGVEEGLEKWTYSLALPHFLAKGQVYFGVPSPADFFSTSQEELFSFLGLIQREAGVFPSTFVGNFKTISQSGNLTVWQGFLQLSDLTSEGKVSSFSYEIYQNSGNKARGTFGISPSLPTIEINSILKASNSPSGVLVGGLPTGIANLTGKTNPSEGVAFVDKTSTIYLPNNVSDLEGIIDEVSTGFSDLAGVPPILGGGSSTSLNPAFALKLSEIGTKILALKELLK